MAVTVVATANHFVVDGLIGAGLTLGSWWLVRTLRRRRLTPVTVTAAPAPTPAAPPVAA